MAGTLIKPPDEVWIFKDAEDEWACVQTRKPSDLFAPCRYVPAALVEAAKVDLEIAIGELALIHKEHQDIAIRLAKATYQQQLNLVTRRAEIAERRVKELTDSTTKLSFADIKRRSAELDAAAGIQTKPKGKK